MDAAKESKVWTRAQMAARVARDIPEGWYVNLGIGMPTMIADHVPLEREVIFHSENGVLGMGPAPPREAINPWLVNAGKQYVTLRTGGAYIHHADSFAMIRGGHLDLCVLGAFQVAANGDIANWSTSENDTAPAVGGAMDLAAGAKRLWVLMDHATKDGKSKLVEQCSYPLTAPRAVKRVYTNLAVLDVTSQGFEVIELAPGLSREELQARTEAELHFSLNGSTSQWDVVVIGGGNAALCAAITAREAGASVLVLEHAPRAMRGGNSRHTRNLRAMHAAPTAVLTDRTARRNTGTTCCE